MATNATTITAKHEDELAAKMQSFISGNPTATDLIIKYEVRESQKGYIHFVLIVYTL